MRVCTACTETFDAADWGCPHCGASPEARDGYPAFAPEMASNAGFKDVHFDELVELEARNFWFRSRNKLIVWALQKYFPDAGSLLEVGCGTGFVLSGISAACPAIKLSGSEISSVGLAYAAKRVPGAELFQMDARAVPFVEEFHVVGAFDVLEHIEEDQKVLDQLYRAIRPQGGLMLTVPQHDFLWSSVDVHACHVRRYSARDLVAKVRAAGFEDVHLTSFVSVLLPLMLVSRLLQRRKNDNYDGLAELKIQGPVNAFLERVLDIERACIKAGVDFPAGGSLLLIARKAK
jgi:SAM-dependent methyltransferase